MTAPAPPKRSPKAVLSNLAAFPGELERLLDGREPEELVRPARDGGWGVVEVLCHLRDWEEIYLDRAHAIVEQDQPHLPAYDDELWAIERDYRGQDPRQTFEHLRQLRSRLVEYLAGLPEEAWARTGDHGVFGRISLQWMADHVCDHDQEHLEQIRDALA